MKAFTSMMWIPEIIDIMSLFLETFYYLGIEFIPPTGGDIDFSHVFED